MEQLRDLVSAHSEPNQLETRRILHTIKGSSSLFGMQELGNLIHQLESQPHISREEIQKIWSYMVDFCVSKQDIFDFHLNAEVFNQSSLVGCQKQAKTTFWLSELESWAQRWLSSTNTEALEEEVGAFVQEASWPHFEEFTTQIPSLVEQISVKLNKNAFCKLKGLGVRLEPKLAAGLLQQIIHCVRNSIDHGIEFPSERIHKPAEAQIEIELVDQDRQWVCLIKDDGRGISSERLLKKANQLGRYTDPTVPPTKEQLYDLIFEDGMSTAEEVTQISGRGVGMSAVKSFLISHGGGISVQSEEGKGTLIEMRLPKPVRSKQIKTPYRVSSLRSA